MVHAAAEQLPCPAGGIRIAAGSRIGCEGDDGKRFGEEITPLPDGTAVPGDMEEHPPVAVKAVVDEERVSQFRAFQPFGALFDRVVQCCQQPCGPALYPYGFIVVDEATIGILHQQKPAVFMVVRTGEPERDRIFEQLFFVEIP